MATVMVVDDDRLFRQRMARTLTDAGLVVIEAAMPGLHGWEVIRFARSKRPSIPVLRLGHADDLVPGREYEAFRRLPVLVKPFTPKELLAALRSRLRLGIKGPALHRKS
jgi:DNA-binding response OmpR family regulator